MVFSEGPSVVGVRPVSELLSPEVGGRSALIHGEAESRPKHGISKDLSAPTLLCPGLAVLTRNVTWSAKRQRLRRHPLRTSLVNTTHGFLGIVRKGLEETDIVDH